MPPPSPINIITKEKVISWFPEHKDYLNGADGCSDCHDLKTPPAKDQSPFELLPPFFMHQVHFELEKTPSATCQLCHPTKDEREFLPNKKNCEDCHPKVHSETGTRCTNCHALPEKAVTAHPSLYQDHRDSTLIGVSCRNCHAIEAGKLILKAVEFCIACHAAIKKLFDEPSPPPFSHPEHDVRKDCIGCHNVKESAEIRRPPAQACLACHADIDHFIKSQPNTCLNCHTGSTEIKPHQGNWMGSHGTSQGIPNKQCFLCHDNNPKVKACADCHARPSLKPPTHQEPNYRYYLHKLDARKKTIDCTSCHDPNTFCAACHTDYRRIPVGHLSIEAFNNHGRAAKQDPESCSSCHGMGRTCYRCHPGGISK